MSADDTTVPDDDELFHPLGSEWEGELEQMLDDTEYDTQLGIDMARDAMRVTKGELSEAEFHQKYHEEVVEEFGVDDRPTAEALEELEARAEEGRDRLSNALSRFDGDDEESRRDAMKKMGAAGAAVGLGAWGTAENAQSDPNGDMEAAAAAEAPEDDEGVQWGMTIDLERCDGCLACMVACTQEHNLDQGVNWMYVMNWEDPDEDMNAGRGRLVRPCQHCTDAPCEKVCPTTARHTRSKDGLVLTDYDVCIGCRYCQVACPYGVNYFQWDDPDVPQSELDPNHMYASYDEDNEGDKRWVDSRAPRGVMSKCTFCPDRQSGGMGEEKIGTSACQEACPPNAIQFGDVNDPESDPNQYLDAIEDDERKISTFKLLEEVGTNPNVTYVGDEPGPNAEQITDEDRVPMTYEDVGLTDNRKDVTDEGTIGGDWY